MAHCLVTGAAGFIGSHLCERLLQAGHNVIGVDAFVAYYPRALKEHHLQSWSGHPAFQFHEVDLRSDRLEPLVTGVDTVFHLAAMPGSNSWIDFDQYMTCNVQATQRLLEAVRAHPVNHFIYGSTSSVYGRFATCDESGGLAPVSPYGVTKLSGEHLCQAYAEAFGVGVTILRFFSVYGPRQRPDMAYHRFIKALLLDEPITIQGDGEQSRSNTFVLDCVEGIYQAFTGAERSINEIFNIGGGEVVTLRQVLNILQELTGVSAKVQYAPERVGDQRSTAANIAKARRVLGYAPATDVRSGLLAQLNWQRELYETHGQQTGTAAH